MFKRLFWLMVGTGFGFGMSFWVTRMLRQTVERYLPERISSDLRRVVRNVGTDVRAAIDEGRAGIAESEARLRADVEARQLARARANN